MNTCRSLLLSVLLVSFSGPMQAANAQVELARGEIVQVNVAEASPFATLAFIAPRSMHVLDFARQVESGVLDAHARHSVTIRAADESWEVMVPVTPRENYGVLVWVSPTAGSFLQASWRDVLDKHGIIAISALQSGNFERSLERRMPLALTGLHWVTSRFPVDADRVYVGGFSGGSKIAQRLVFAFPGIFRGAILNAGFLEPGEEELPLPDAVLYRQLVQRPFVFVTGRRDYRAIPFMREALEAFEQYCLPGPKLLQLPQKAHQIMGAKEMDDALAHLARKRGYSPDNDCLDELIAEARAAAKSNVPVTEERLRSLDVRYGALIRNEILALHEGLAD